MKQKIRIYVAMATIIFAISNTILLNAQQHLQIETGVNSNAWVLVPAGVFYKGQHNHETTINYDYEIMVTDVTNAQYAKYLDEALASGFIKMFGDTIKGYHPGDKFNGYKHEFEIKAGYWTHMVLSERGIRIKYDGNTFTVQKGFENHPVIMVSWFGAKSYTDFYGWRLPTELEWEKAARGKDTRAYPWGNNFGNFLANYYSSFDVFEKTFGKLGGTTPVGFYNGKTYGDFKTYDNKSPYGLYDMAGNVWQWVGDDKPDVHYRYMRGGSLATYEQHLRVWSENNAGPDYYGLDVGFRCARDVSAVNREK